MKRVVILLLALGACSSRESAHRPWRAHCADVRKQMISETEVEVMKAAASPKPSASPSDSTKELRVPSDAERRLAALSGEVPTAPRQPGKPPHETGCRALIEDEIGARSLGELDRAMAEDAAFTK